MKHFLISTLLMVISTCAGPAFAQTFVEKQAIEPVNLLSNPGFENKLAKFKVSGGTFQHITGLQDVAFGKGAARWLAGAASRTLCSENYELPAGYRGENGLASVRVKVPSGTATHVLKVIQDNAKVLNSREIISDTRYTETQVTFVYSRGVSFVKVCLEAVASSEPSIDVDDFKLGVNVGIGNTETRQSTFTRLTSGSGTYTPPAGATRLRIRMVGGGGGGAGSGTTAGASPGAGGATTFGAHTAGGGGFGNTNSIGGGGGSGTIGSGAVGIVIAGQGGGVSTNTASSGVTAIGGTGGSSFLGGGGLAGGGTGGPYPGGIAGGYGGGGGGGGFTGASAFGGSGGGGGGGLDITISSPLASSYAYSVGAPGAAGAGGAAGVPGGYGGSGYIEIEEIYGPVPVFTADQGADLLGTSFETYDSLCPANSALEDGSAVSRTDPKYAALFNKYGTKFGVGDGSTTFNLPNSLGLVKRAYGSQAINGRTKTGPTNPGDKQEDQMQGHFHDIGFFGTSSGSSNRAQPIGDATIDYNNTFTTTSNMRARSTLTDGTNGTPRVGPETQVSAIGIRPCIWLVSQPMPLFKAGVIYSDVVRAEGVNGITSIDENYFTPTVSIGGNISVVTVDRCSYDRIGRRVNASCSIAATFASVGVYSSFDLSLPVGSTCSGDLSGNVNSVSQTGTVGGVACISNKVGVRISPAASGSATLNIDFSYRIP